MQPNLFGESLERVRRRPSGPHQEAVDGWTRLWEETRGEPYVWTPREQHFVKLGLKLAGTTWAYLNRARTLLLSPPNVWYAQNASPCLLYSRWNQLAVTVKKQSVDERNLLSLRTALEGL